MKLRDIYQLTPQEHDTEFPLVKWYNTLINKEIEELNMNDICRMINQNVLIDLGIEKAIEMLKLDPLAGEKYDGQLLEILFSVEKEKLLNYKDTLKEILIGAKANVKVDTFICAEEFQEYQELVEKFLKKINSF